MCFAQTDFPRQASVLDGSERRRACAAIMSADGNDVGTGLCHSSGDDADPRSRNKFHSDAGTRVHRAQIVNQLRQIFDAVDIVMRRRRNQRRARHGMPNARDVRSNFARGKLTTLAGL